MGFHRKDPDFLAESPEEAGEEYLRQLLGQQSVATGSLGETEFPPLDIYEASGSIVVEAELPGVDPDDLEVSIAAGTLVIEGMKEEVLEPGRVNFLCMERTFGGFRRIVPLLLPFHAAAIKARYCAGILEIRIPKAPERRGTRKAIPVTAG